MIQLFKHLLKMIKKGHFQEKQIFTRFYIEWIKDIFKNDEYIIKSYFTNRLNKHFFKIYYNTSNDNNDF